MRKNSPLVPQTTAINQNNKDAISNVDSAILEGTGGTLDILKIMATPRAFVAFELTFHEVEIKANGEVKKSGNIFDINALTNQIYLDFQDAYSNLSNEERRRVGVRTKADIQTALEEQILHSRIIELERLKSSLEFESSNEDPLTEFLIAVTGKCTQLDMAIVKHFIWQIRRKLFGLPVEHHLMPVLYGEQGSGKSRALELLLSPISSVVLHTSLSEIVDDRLQPQLGNHFVALLDEMAGASKTDIASLKRIMTLPTVMVRKLGTSNLISVPQNCTFIGATNKELNSQIKDPTGMRRFYEMKTLARMDWKAIGSIDYLKIWKSIDENSNVHLSDVMNELREHQKNLVPLDQVDEFIDEMEISPESQNKGVFVSTVDLYNRFQEWATGNGYKNYPVKSVFGSLLSQKGFQKDQRKVSGKTSRGFYLKESLPSEDLY